ncbi:MULTISPECIES: hypothetical protein [unclassified Bradyrhizobium]|uniref:hypothetical protein n=1 Tax=unclassified Bradyrhizobium TaxID=2631580 RepID=UPI001CD21994|nr:MULTISPECIES: hypothetical protein [unclassified Bradyrhizobium]MCA1386094.1 hypothetical protein [Bradyrhizobium sp. BRP05]MCA1393892.1 hypothetical protein [Bradyrhizobium sp. IC3123]MCA1423536.1 hypothetical protein [Bradyrhizobium sp. BRP23]MCA1431094.1 hypothetical protein [Bradyrhizobium sp. NBAIM16]MCA1480081.1 hypothetical protein [Bradyrhizobium sp. NBAIM08]
MIIADPTLTTRISAYFERVGDIGQVASSAPQLDSPFEPKLNCKTPALGDTPLSTLRDAISIAPTLLGVTIPHNDQRFMASGRRLSNGAQDLPVFFPNAGTCRRRGCGVLIWAATTSPSFIGCTIDLLVSVRSSQSASSRRQN